MYVSTTVTHVLLLSIRTSLVFKSQPDDDVISGKRVRLKLLAICCMDTCHIKQPPSAVQHLIYRYANALFPEWRTCANKYPYIPYIHIYFKSKANILAKSMALAKVTTLSLQLNKCAYTYIHVSSSHTDSCLLIVARFVQCVLLGREPHQQRVCLTLCTCVHNFPYKHTCLHTFKLNN